MILPIFSNTNGNNFSTKLTCPCKTLKSGLNHRNREHHCQAQCLQCFTGKNQAKVCIFLTQLASEKSRARMGRIKSFWALLQKRISSVLEIYKLGRIWFSSFVSLLMSLDHHFLLITLIDKKMTITLCHFCDRLSGSRIKYWIWMKNVFQGCHFFFTLAGILFFFSSGRRQFCNLFFSSQICSVYALI